MSTNSTEAYDAFITQAVTELEKDGADAAAIEAAVFAMQKTRLLFTGAPVGTILRNKETGESASRAVNITGIPVWHISSPTGDKYDSHETVLQPEADWLCIFDPDA